MRLICGARQTGKTTRCVELIKEKLELAPDGEVRFIASHASSVEWRQLFETHGLDGRVKVEVNAGLHVSLPLTKEDPFFEEIFIDNYLLSDPNHLPRLIKMMASVEQWLETPITLVIQSGLEEVEVKDALNDLAHDVILDYLPKLDQEYSKMVIEERIATMLHSIFGSNIDLSEDSFEVKGAGGYVLAQLKKADQTSMTMGAKREGEMFVPLNIRRMSIEERNRLIKELLGRLCCLRSI